METIQRKTYQHQLTIFSTITTNHNYGRLLQIKHEGLHKFHKICNRGKFFRKRGRGLFPLIRISHSGGMGVHPDPMMFFKTSHRAPPLNEAPKNLKTAPD